MLLRHPAARTTAFTAALFGLLTLPTGPALAADTLYDQDRAACLAGRTGQSQADCLREAGAARDEARRRTLTTEPAAARIANAQRRCAVHAAADIRAACERLALGEGSSSGSVAGGGVLRSITLPASSAASGAPAAAAPASAVR